MSAFATYAIRAATRVASGTLISHDSSKPLDADDDPCALLERARKLPGRIVVIRTSDGARIAARLTAPGALP